MAGPNHIYYRAEPANERLVEPMDCMALIFQRRSGLTHIVAEPVLEILAAMGSDVVDAKAVFERLAAEFDMVSNDAEAIVEARLEELALLGLVEKLASTDV